MDIDEEKIMVEQTQKPDFIKAKEKTPIASLPEESRLPLISIVIPLYQEADNVSALMAALHQALATFRHPWQVILVDDGSEDPTLKQLLAAQAVYGKHVHILALRRNFGQSAAMQAGIDHAEGDIVVLMDGDLQNDPSDIPMLVETLLTKDLDVISGWRQARHDVWWRRLQSQIANAWLAALTGLPLHDYGCSLKAYRREVLEPVRLYGEMHRFIPAWVSKYTKPSRIGEAVVKHHPRRAGQSKYGFFRTFRVLIDLLSVWFFLRFHARPGHFFGGIGLWFAAFGTIALSYLFTLKFVFGQDIGQRPLLLMAVFALMLAVQFFTTGIIGEMLTRIFFQDKSSPSFVFLKKYQTPNQWRQPNASVDIAEKKS